MNLGGLNQDQLRAVQHGEGPALVVAGAGTGKTHVITMRIARLIEAGVEPGSILALTFTEKAAREMAERLYDLIGWRSYQVPVLTFNAFGAELLGRYATHIGRSIRGGLINDMQKALILKQHIHELKLDYYGAQADLFEFCESIVNYLNQLQNAGVTPESYARYVDELRQNPGEMHPHDVDEQSDLARLYAFYSQLKQKTGTIDYYDQLHLPLQILEQRPNLAQRLQEQYHYVLVDEYQDTNTVQDALIRQFVPKNGNIFAVGDDDQAIYGFRGAQIDNILSFTDHFDNVQPLVLIENYRSGQEILDASYRLIKHNDPERLEHKLKLDKHLHAQKQGSQIDFKGYSQVEDEVQGLVAVIEERLEGGEEPQSIAVLASTHAPLRRLAKALKSASIPYALSTQTSIFEQTELKQLWYLLQWIGHEAQPESIAHVLLSRFFNWRAEDYRNLLNFSRDKLMEIEAALRELATTDELAADAVKKLDQWREWAAEIPVSQLTYKLFFETGVSQELIAIADRSDRIVRVFEDLERLLVQMQDYEIIAIDATLTGYLQTFPKPPTIEVAEPVGEEQGVQLLTVHASKGLEFDTVYLMGCTHLSWSGGAAIGREVPEALKQTVDLPSEHEFRRLMYVAVTRSKRFIQLSAATQRSDGTKQTVSPFITELLGESAMIHNSQTQKNRRKFDE